MTMFERRFRKKNYPMITSELWQVDGKFHEKYVILKEIYCFKLNFQNALHHNIIYMLNIVSILRVLKIDLFGIEMKLVLPQWDNTTALIKLDRVGR